MKIAVEGCAHGELENIYNTIQGIEKAENIKVDLLLCCGDFQSTRNLADLQTMAVPRKYQHICTFYKYYSGELKAPILTIFIGGNHEASNYLQELPYGGWVAPNIYYIGYAGVVRVNGLRIGGISGISKEGDYLRGRHEFPPYSEDTRRSVYHVRQLEVFRLKQLTGKIDIFMSHDWPRGVYNYGDKEQLMRFKPHFRQEIETDRLGSKPCSDLLKFLKPAYWFAAHLHCQFKALVPHNDNSNDDIAADDSCDSIASNFTKFLALDKCLPKRRFLQILDIEDKQSECNGEELVFEYDEEWLAILQNTNHLISVKKTPGYMPGQCSSGERFNFTPTNEEITELRRKFFNNLSIPPNFHRTVQAYDPNNVTNKYPPQPEPQINPQTTQLCETLGIDDPLSLAMVINGKTLNHSVIIDDQSFEATSSFECSDTSIMASPATLKRRSGGLNLPEPKSAEKNLTTEEINSSLNNSLSNSLHEALASLDTNSSATSQKLEEDGAASNVNYTSPVKKFKRRNVEMYKEEEEQETTNVETL